MKLFNLLLTSFICATSYADISSVGVPQLPGGIYIGASALYLQPSISDNDLAYASINNISSSPATASQLKFADFSYSWNWQAIIGYVFPNTANDVFIDYFQLGDNETKSTAGNLTSISFPVSIVNDSAQLTDFSSGFSNSSANVKLSLDQVDAAFGQQITIGSSTVVHPFVGLRFIDFDRKINSLDNGSFTAAVSPTVSAPKQLPTTTFPVNVSTQQKTDFTGVGPLLGTDVAYNFNEYIAIVGHFAASLLAGSSDASLNTAITSSGGEFISGDSVAPFTDTYAVKTDNKLRIGGDLDSRLGLALSYPLSNHSSRFTLEGGYAVADYFNIIDKINAAGNLSLVDSVGGVFTPVFSATTISRRTANLFIDGPYVSLTFYA